MANKQQAPGGAWHAQLQAQDLTRAQPKIAESLLVNDTVFWLESVNDEAGRITVRCRHQGEIQTRVPAPFNVRSKVHEYGGGSYCIAGDMLVFCNAQDQKLYRCSATHLETPVCLTPDTALRFGDLTWDATQQSVLAVAEEHRAQGVDNFLVSITLAGEIRELQRGADFYAAPRLNHDGSLLCWLSWSHPDMPWDKTVLSIARRRADGHLEWVKHYGNEHSESLVQPLWAPNNDLYFIGDRNNWWNIQRIRANHWSADLPAISAESVYEHQAEYATPLWNLRMQNYAWLDAERLIASFTENGFWHLAEVNTHTRELKRLDGVYAALESVHSDGGDYCCVAHYADRGAEILRFSADQAQGRTVSTPSASPDGISRAQAIRFPVNAAGDEAHAFYYPPLNPEFELSEAPPLITLCHGGPTGQSTAAYSEKIQFWTQRGFAVVDVNYRGSTGYGRDFRRALYGQWGIADVDDAVAAADYLVQRGLAHPDKLIIKGGSAGAYTVLAALAFRERFTIGVSLYGIGDLELLARDTHKFEARYMDQLIGPYPERADLYRDRSPVHAVDQFNCALLLFQGLEDKVVPPNQARAMASAVREKNQAVALVEYPNEAHGFRDPATICHMLNAELYFYQRVFGLIEGDNSVLMIDNLPPERL